jgi:hypothetical protein
MQKSITTHNNTIQDQELDYMIQGQGQQQLVQPFTHSVKITDTAKGIRIDVHFYANDSKTTVKEVLDTYMATKREAEKNGIIIAPIEIKDSK